MQMVLQVEKCCSTAVRTKLIEVGAGARRAKRNEKVQLLGVYFMSIKIPTISFLFDQRNCWINLLPENTAEQKIQNQFLLIYKQLNLMDAIVEKYKRICREIWLPNFLQVRLRLGCRPADQGCVILPRPTRAARRDVSLSIWTGIISQANNQNAFLWLIFYI